MMRARAELIESCGVVYGLADGSRMVSPELVVLEFKQSLTEEKVLVILVDRADGRSFAVAEHIAGLLDYARWAGFTKADGSKVKKDASLYFNKVRLSASSMADVLSLNFFIVKAANLWTSTILPVLQLGDELKWDVDVLSAAHLPDLTIRRATEEELHDPRHSSSKRRHRSVKERISRKEESIAVAREAKPKKRPLEPEPDEGTVEETMIKICAHVCDTTRDLLKAVEVMSDRMRTANMCLMKLLDTTVSNAAVQETWLNRINNALAPVKVEDECLPLPRTLEVFQTEQLLEELSRRMNGGK